ncbi:MULTISPECIES: mechanosensitive ion channel family protein [Tenacibaculum]|uniref:mechanosensitive ion channel family protein n=1 Tax=Tenacibaculum TaxID=104267 RepID=UPI001F0AEDBF|nr:MULTISPECIES: mechanosensitive ion channel domain-containing protein [Tenacibaculum]MCH3882411.1 mechanosensitive ion channel [Tenacibaculum aquimarinum]MCH3885802.1 mechanosensitive ion channel [Tenacibaculum aquimarinum]MDO6600106.1 mechanosensitive ion channel [Tenacibaculum sp. 1_MG-2023]
MKTLKEFLNLSFDLTETIHIDVKTILFVVFVFFITGIVLKTVKRIINRKLNEEDKDKFKAIYSFIKYFVYTVVLIIALESSGIDVSVLLAGSAALLVGIGLGLQTLFQDIMSGVFILIDKSLHVNDIIEIEGKVGKVEEIRLRTTRAVTIDNKVLIIPNHKFLTNSLYNWTQNGKTTRENVTIGVAYGSDVELVKSLLIQAAKEHPKVYEHPAPLVIFQNFGESALEFKLVFTLSDSYQAVIPQSDIRFRIDQLFRENNISIPFPQRTIHVVKE